MSVKERIKQYQETMGLSDYAFNKTIEKPQGWWSKCTNPTSENLQSILEHHPEISAEWLLRGEGNMIKDAKMAQEIFDEGLERYYKAILAMKNERIEQLEAELALLKAKAI